MPVKSTISNPPITPNTPISKISSPASLPVPHGPIPKIPKTATTDKKLTPAKETPIFNKSFSIPAAYHGGTLRMHGA